MGQCISAPKDHRRTGAGPNKDEVQVYEKYQRQPSTKYKPQINFEINHVQEVKSVERRKDASSGTRFGWSVGRQQNRRRAQLLHEDGTAADELPRFTTDDTTNPTFHQVITSDKDQNRTNNARQPNNRGTFPIHRSRVPRRTTANIFEPEIKSTDPPEPVRAMFINRIHQQIQHVTIPNGLDKRLQNYPMWTSVPFFITNRIGTYNARSFDCVPSQFPIPFLHTKITNELILWPVIAKKLGAIETLCKQGNSPMDIIYDAVSSYCPTALEKSNFHMLDRGDISQILITTLPIISEMALKLPTLLEEHVPLLLAGRSKTIFLTREICCSLLANAFFCTFPPHQLKKMPDFNFFNLYNDTTTARCEVKKEKIKCILNYFVQMSTANTNRKFLDQIISFERRCISEKISWSQANDSLCEIKVEARNNIEHAHNMLQVDFANKVVGGGVLNDGSVMEEIRFCLSPELIVSRLFTQTLNDDEVLTVTGTEIFSRYKGYSTTFQFCGPSAIKWENQPVDNFGRTFTQIVAMDALHFKRDTISAQFQKHKIDRELHKCRVAFHTGHHISNVATGNWGCGAFNGNKELKFIIQWLAASKMKRPIMQYHTAGDNAQGQALTDIYIYAKQRNINIGQLYHVITQYATDKHTSKFPNLFDYVRYRIK